MSTKRGPVGPYSYDDDEDYVPSKAVKYSSLDEQPGPAKKKAHTLDSDEEDLDDEGGGDCEGDQKPYDVLKEDDIVGQEEQTLEYEGETTITPFNMKEELEEGHFDGDGFYHFKKESEMKDAWLDDIDWIKIKRAEENKNKYGSDDEESDDDDSIGDKGGDLDLPEVKASQQQQQQGEDGSLAVYRQMIELLKPEETVTRALKRLGGGKKLTSAQKWKLKKQSNSTGEQQEQSSAQQDSMQCMLRLTELANKVVETGNMDVYQETYEMIAVKLRPPKSASPVLDMFTDAPPSAATDTATENGTEHKSTVDEVRWQLKWENKEDAEVHGSFPSTQMVKWQESGYLDKGAYVRKLSDREGSWYHTKRIEFDLYV